MSDLPPTRSFFAGMLMVVGGLIAGLCGLCTGFFQIGFLYDAIRSGRGETGGEINLPFYAPLMIGGLPIAFGVALFLWGRWLVRASAPRIPPLER